ncbi:hypothetical protein ABZ626_37970 [Streptomyces longispororuber]|uniref:hypothetical protein n=1 Tax=Streptomyces longispororuber TaxID=68230 RepID=UPI0033CFA98F
MRKQRASIRGWMMVIGNLDTPGNLEPSSYRGWLRPAGGGLLLVTSRDSAPATWSPRSRRSPSAQLPEAQPHHLLRSPCC